MTRIQSRRDTAANWLSVNPILALGEIGIEIDTHKMKTGDGSLTWNSLPYMTGPIDGINSRIQLSRKTTSQWATLDPVLYEGEPAFDIETGSFKIGNGSLKWSELPEYLILSSDNMDIFTHIEHLLEDVADETNSIEYLFTSQSVSASSTIKSTSCIDVTNVTKVSCYVSNTGASSNCTVNIYASPTNSTTDMKKTLATFTLGDGSATTYHAGNGIDPQQLDNYIWGEIINNDALNPAIITVTLSVFR